MKNKFLILITLIALSFSSCKKETQIYIDNSSLVQYALTADSVQLKTCKYGIITFPNPTHGGYNPAMKIMFSLNPNVLINTTPIDSFSCELNKIFIN